MEILLDELWPKALKHAHHVVSHQHLTVTRNACANADRGYCEPLADQRRKRSRYLLQNYREAAEVLQQQCLVYEPFRSSCRRCPEDRPAELMKRLRSHTEVSHHWYACVYDSLNLICDCLSSSTSLHPLRFLQNRSVLQRSVDI